MIGFGNALQISTTRQAFKVAAAWEREVSAKPEFHLIVLCEQRNISS
jgi:hypothetical protein